MLRRCVVVTAVLACALAGCSKTPRMTLPAYPGAVGVPSGPPEQIAGGKIFHASSRAVDSMPMVRNWYEGELVTKLKWTYQPSGIGHAWNNGNMRWASGGGQAGRVEVDDPTKEGGFVQAIEMDNATQIEAWQYVPTPAKK